MTFDEVLRGLRQGKTYRRPGIAKIAPVDNKCEFGGDGLGLSDRDILADDWQAVIAPGDRFLTFLGKGVQIYAVHEQGNYPIHGAVLIGSFWRATAWNWEGTNRDDPAWQINF